MNYCKQIVLTELTDGFSWFIYQGEKVIACGSAKDRFQAFKEACAAFDKAEV